MRNRCLHGSKAVAELKVLSKRLIRHDPERLHGSKAVAELKAPASSRALSSVRRRCLHGSKAVAELKGTNNQILTTARGRVSTAQKPWPN